MTEHTELWQEYKLNGEQLVGVGYTSSEFAFDSKICGAAHVWLWRRNGKEKEILLQKRAKTVRVHPGCWDISTAGHVNLGESSIEAAVREAKEELDISIDGEKLDFIFTLCPIKQNPRYREIHFVYLYELKENNYEFNIDEKEVEEVMWVNQAELLRMISKKENIVPHSKTYYTQLIDYLNER